MPAPKEYDRDKIMDYVCDALATSSRGLGNILTYAKDELDKVPTYSQIMRWLDEDEAIRDRYARAKEAQADFMADEMLDIADDARNDWMTKQNGSGEPYKVVGTETIQRSKLRIDARKWLASKLKPKKYSEKLQTEHSGPDGGPIKTTSSINFIPVSRKSKEG
jgi:hypothetical protein